MTDKLKFDVDDRKARQIVKDNPQAFNEFQVLPVMDAVGAIVDALLDARIEERLRCTSETREQAEQNIIAYLKGTEE